MTKNDLYTGTLNRQSIPFLQKTTLIKYIILFSCIDLGDVIEAFTVTCPPQGSIFVGAAETRQSEGGGV